MKINKPAKVLESGKPLIGLPPAAYRLVAECLATADKRGKGLTSHILTDGIGLGVGGVDEHVAIWRALDRLNDDIAVGCWVKEVGINSEEKRHTSDQGGGGNPQRIENGFHLSPPRITVHAS